MGMTRKLLKWPLIWKTPHFFFYKEAAEKAEDEKIKKF